MAKHSIRIDYSEGELVATVTAAAPFGKDQTATISFRLNFDPNNPTPRPKRRDNETDDEYSRRLATINPAAVDVSAEYASGLKERLEEILKGVSPIGDHFAARAAAAHTLAAKGEALPGVQVMQINSKLAASAESKNKK